MKIFTQSVCILCSNRENICATAFERKCAAASEHIFCLNKRVAASGNISCFFKYRAAASEKIIMVPSNFEKHKICSNGTKSLLLVN